MVNYNDCKEGGMGIKKLFLRVIKILYREKKTSFVHAKFLTIFQKKKVKGKF